MPQLQILEANPVHGWSGIGAAVGKGLGEGMLEGQKLTLADKMEQLKEQRQRDTINKQLNEIDKTIPGMRNAVMALGPQGAAKILSERGPQEFAEIFSPQQQQMPSQAPIREEIPIEDREAIEEPTAEVPAKTGEPKGAKSIDDYIKEIDPRYAQRGPQQKEQIQRQAERKFNAAMKLSEAEDKKQERLEKKQEPFVKEVRTKADAAKTILNAATNMEKIRSRGNLGITSKARGLFAPEARADRAAYDSQASQFLAFYKALFPRGFTQQEFKHIESNWIPNSSNTDERNQAIEESFKDMAQTLVQKAQILDSLRDENGLLPPNAVQKVDQMMGEKIKELQNKFTSSIPSGGKAEERSAGMDKLPNASEHKDRTIVDTKTGSKFKSNGKTWVKVQ